MTPWPIVIELAGPPRGKGAGRAAIAKGRAHVFTDARTRKYEAQLRYAAQQVMAGAAPATGAVRVTVTAWLPVPGSFSKAKRAAALAGTLRPITRPDVENYCKALDALNGVVWVDDKQIVDETISKRYATQPGLTIAVALIVTPASAAPVVKRPRGAVAQTPLEIGLPAHGDPPVIRRPRDPMAAE